VCVLMGSTGVGVMGGKDGSAPACTPQRPRYKLQITEENLARNSIGGHVEEG
jgi:hypothetical protein